MRNIPLTLVHVIFAQARGPALPGKPAPPAAEPNPHEKAVGQKIIADAVNVLEGSPQPQPGPESMARSWSGHPS